MNVKLGGQASRTSTIRSSTTGTVAGNSLVSVFNVCVDTACPICQEPVGQPTPEGKIEGWSRLPCGHEFGSHCIKHWLGIVADERPCCPMCRQNAAYACGHPVLPEILTGNGSTSTKARPQPAASREKDTNGCSSEKPLWSPSELLATRWCDFCRLAVDRRRKKRSMPWRFARGCWRLVRHGRIRETRRERMRAVAGVFPNHNGMFAYWSVFRRAEWQIWWQGQEPKDA